MEGPNFLLVFLGARPNGAQGLCLGLHSDKRPCRLPSIKTGSAMCKDKCPGPVVLPIQSQNDKVLI